MKIGDAEQVVDGALYTRISRDPEGLRLGVERQRDDLEDFARRSGVRVVGRYEDNDIGASTRSRKRRPRYEQMIADAAKGGIRVIIAYTSSRLTRRPRENEDLIELAERHGVQFRYLRSPSFDLNTADGRNIARILAANDAAESERIAERVSRAARQRAEDGGFHGGSAAFGYEQVTDAAERVTAWAPHPVHAQWLREAATRVLAGESLYGICAEWHRAGRRTGNDAVWRPRTLKRALLSPAVVGMRAYAGELFPASWEPVLDREVWDRLQTMLTDDGRMTRPWPGHDTRRKYMLSGLVFCRLCGKTMGSMTKSSGGPHAFFCSTIATGGCGKTRIAMEPLERWVHAAFLEALTDVTLAPPTSQDGAQDEDAVIRGAILTDEQALEQVNSDYYDQELKKHEWLRQRARLNDRIEANRARLSDQTARIARGHLPAPGEIARLWPDKDNAWRRSMLAAVIERIDIDAFPAGMASTLTRRKGESDTELTERRAAHLATVHERRVSITWRA
jgi:DNA invertase Pin-like site-specific DNA recombinase